MSREFCHEIIQMVMRGRGRNDFEVVTLDDESEEGKRMRSQAASLREQKAQIERDLSQVETRLVAVEDEERARELANMSSVMGLLKMHIEDSQRGQVVTDDEVRQLRASVADSRDEAAMWKRKYLDAQADWARERQELEAKIASISSSAPQLQSAQSQSLFTANDSRQSGMQTADSRRTSTSTLVLIEELELPTTSPPQRIDHIGIEAQTVAEGVLVTVVDGGSLASRAGIRVDDTIIDFASTSVKTAQDLSDVCKELPTKPFPVGIFRPFPDGEPRLLWKIFNQSAPVEPPTRKAQTSSPTHRPIAGGSPPPPLQQQAYSKQYNRQAGRADTSGVVHHGIRFRPSQTTSPSRKSIHGAKARSHSANADYRPAELNRRDDQLVFKKPEQPTYDSIRAGDGRMKPVIPKLNLQIFPQNNIPNVAAVPAKPAAKVPLNALHRKVTRTASHGNNNRAVEKQQRFA